jgi:hypothetical protein
MRSSRALAGDAGAGEDHNTGWQDFEHAVIALERRGLAVAGPVGPEGDLRDLAVIGPAGGGFLRAFRRAAMDQLHTGNHQQEQRLREGWWTRQGSNL